MAMADMASAEGNNQSVEHLGDSTYPSHLSSALNQLRQQVSLCDVAIIVGDQRFPAHRVVLSCASNYFQCMFSSGFQESTSDEVTVPGTGESFAQLLEFAYTGFFALSPTTVSGILSMACYMNFTQAVDVCTRYLSTVKDKISIDDCFEIWSLAGNHGSLSELVESFHRHLVYNFPKCVKSENFLEHATVDFLLECLEDEEIETDTSTELQILEVVIGWLNYDWEKRRIHTTSLLKRIRLGLVPQEHLKELLASEIANVEECKQMMEEIVELQSIGESCTVEPLSHRYPAWFATRNTISAILNLGGMLGPCYFDDKCSVGGMWKKLNWFPPIPYPIEGILSGEYKLAVVNERLYAAGGSTWVNTQASAVDGDVTDRVWMGSGRICKSLNNLCMYNSCTNEWQELSPMRTSRKAFAMIGFSGYIYAIGGIGNKGAKLVEVERYSLVGNVWEECPSLLYPVASGSVTIYKGNILICGTKLNRTEMSVVIQMYNQQASTWCCVLEEVCPLGLKRTYLLNVQKSMLYLISYTHENDEAEVKQLLCNFDGEEPSITIGRDVGQCTVCDCPKGKTLKFFCINESVFIGTISAQCLAQVPAEVLSGKDVYDLSRWQNLFVTEYMGLMGVLFSFDKRRLSSK